MYFILKDFRSYAEAQERVEAAYKDEKKWARSAMLNTAKSGKFSSDRTIEEYAKRNPGILTKLKLRLRTQTNCESI